MEPHKEIPAGIDLEDFRPDVDAGPRAYYEKARDFALRVYPGEVQHIASTKLDELTPEKFFREYIWVVHATGFSAKAVGKFMPRLVDAYGPWETLSKDSFEDMMGRVKLVCNNPQKAGAVQKMARALAESILVDGTPDQARWEEFRDNSLSTTDLLTKLPYIGKVTCFHLGRNIGLLECVKPDLHLIRLAEYWGFPSCDSMCISMRGSDEVPLGIVDLYLWYAASTFGTIHVKKEGQR